MTAERSEDSEFGRGYATCLRQFTFHAARLTEQLALWRRMRDDRGDLFSEASAVETWANGASDHLYELMRPAALPNDEWRRAESLQGRALDIGHGFHPTSKSNEAEALGLLDVAASLLADLEGRGFAVATLPEAIETDRKMSLDPAAGSWSCAEDLRLS